MAVIIYLHWLLLCFLPRLTLQDKITTVNHLNVKVVFDEIQPFLDEIEWRANFLELLDEPKKRTYRRNAILKLKKEQLDRRELFALISDCGDVEAVEAATSSMKIFQSTVWRFKEALVNNVTEIIEQKELESLDQPLKGLIDKALADDQENIETTSTDTAISYIRENVWDPFKGKYLFNMKRQLELATQLENNLNFREKILEEVEMFNRTSLTLEDLFENLAKQYYHSNATVIKEEHVVPNMIRVYEKDFGEIKDKEQAKQRLMLLNFTIIRNYDEETGDIARVVHVNAPEKEWWPEEPKTIKEHICDWTFWICELLFFVWIAAWVLAIHLQIYVWMFQGVGVVSVYVRLLWIFLGSQPLLMVSFGAIVAIAYLKTSQNSYKNSILFRGSGWASINDSASNPERKNVSAIMKRMIGNLRLQ